MHINNENFISARYVDNEKKHVEILYKDGEQTLGHVIEHDTQHPDWQELMAMTTIDELHANTHAYIKQSQKDFKSYVMKMAKEDGLVKEVVAELSTKFYDEVFEFFFNYDDKQKEMLFNFKLFNLLFNWTKRYPVIYLSFWFLFRISKLFLLFRFL